MALNQVADKYLVRCVELNDTNEEEPGCSRIFQEESYCPDRIYPNEAVCTKRSI